MVGNFRENAIRENAKTPPQQCGRVIPIQRFGEHVRQSIDTALSVNPFPGNERLDDGEWIQCKSVLRLVIQGRMEVGALLQIFGGVTLRTAVPTARKFDAGCGGQSDACGNGGCGDGGKYIQIHGGHLSKVHDSGGSRGRCGRDSNLPPVTDSQKSFVALTHIDWIDSACSPLAARPAGTRLILR